MAQCDAALRQLGFRVRLAARVLRHPRAWGAEVGASGLLRRAPAAEATGHVLPLSPREPNRYGPGP